MRPVRGFSLVELLVVIAIITILATAATVIYSRVQLRARDSARKHDLRSIQLALESYFQRNSSYPGISLALTWYQSTSTTWIPGLTPDFITTLPTDRSGNGGNPWAAGGTFGYAYRTAQDNENGNGSCIRGNQYYLLIARLEGTTDADRLGAPGKDVNFCNQSLLTGYTYSSQDFVLTNP